MVESLHDTVISWVRSGGWIGLVLAMTVENLVECVPNSGGLCDDAGSPLRMPCQGCRCWRLDSISS
jgi:hypothetical protein